MERVEPHTNESSVFARPLASLTKLCCRCPLTVLCLSVLLAIVSLYWTAQYLTMKMSRLDLINPNSEFNQLWLEYIDEFGDSDEVIVAIEGKNNDVVIPVLDKLAQRIDEFPNLFQSVLSGVDLSALKSKGLHYVPTEELQKILAAIQNPSQAQNPLAAGNSAGDGISEVQQLLNKVGGNFSYENYFIFPTRDGVFGFVLLKINGVDKTQFSQGDESIGKLRSIISEVQTEYPALNIGLTGMPILENDEMRLSNEAMAKATLLALGGVAIVFMAGFGSIRLPLYALVALIIAFAWTMGYITLVVGHLNILSIAFGAMLIGLGTDFSVHYLARYLDLRKTGVGVQQALCQTAEIVGPGILTGAFTTSAAFFAASFAEFTGIAELGTIAGGGILFCAITTFTVFPAMIVLWAGGNTDKNGEKNKENDGDDNAKTVSINVQSAKLSMSPLRQIYDIRPAIAPFFWSPHLTFFLFVVGFSALCCGIPKVWYDYNLLHLQPEGLESVEWEERLLDTGSKNIWFALSIADTKDELLERKKRFAEKYPDLKTEAIVSLIPNNEPEKLKTIQEIHHLLSSSVHAAPTGLQDSQLRSLSSQLLSMSNPNPPTVDDLPKPLVERFIGKRGKHLMRIYSTANIWDMVELKEFVNNVRDIDPKATGSPLQTYESSLQMQQGFITAAVYAFGAIFILLLIDFRSWGASVTTLLPTILGFTMMFGVMGWLDLPLNAANMIVLPLILGIGIDDGVHLIHDYRSRRNDRRYKMSASTATSMMITSLTTIIGFGSMMIASHRGLQSLGRVLVIGIVCCLFTSLILLPVLIKIFTAQSGSKNSNPPKPDEPTETNIHVETTISQNFPNNSNNSQKQKRLVRREES